MKFFLENASIKTVATESMCYIDHPSYIRMIYEALLSVNNGRQGMSRQEIAEYIQVMFLCFFALYDKCTIVCCGDFLE